MNYYRFPDDTPENVLLKEGCAVILKSGYRIYVDEIPEERRKEVEYIDHSIGGLKISGVKQLIKQYGGCGWTEHIDRDGCIFETSSINLNGNNSKHKYNRHL